MHGCQDLEEMVFPDFSRFSLTKLEKFPWLFFRRNMNFGWQSDFPTIQGFQLDFFQEYFRYGWWKFEFWWSEIVPEWRISAIFLRIISPWLKKILNFDHLKFFQSEGFQPFFWEYFHHGWRTFWILIIWSCSRMKNFSYFSENIFTIVEENFEFDGQWLQNEGFQLFSREYFHHGWRKFWILMVWNGSKMKDFSYFPGNIFTMV